jgi:hypothetical protein
MVAPRAETIFDWNRHVVVGVVLRCPECSGVLANPLRVETIADYVGVGGIAVPELVRNAGALGFILRCDVCGFRVEMHGDRLPTVAMLKDFR